MSPSPINQAYLRLNCFLLLSIVALGCGSALVGTTSNSPPGTPPQNTCIDGSNGYVSASGTPPGIQGCAVFPPSNPWNTDVLNYRVDPGDQNPPRQRL